ncbi:MAG TPA: VCBS repeat-containing protein, partial [Fimbriiglobus sp.]|nr:VCBS repeat-containing protein [Fimbriiglobus sp.]
LTAIPFPSVLTNSWKAQFNRPSGVGQDEEVVNLIVPANSVYVFVGSRDVGVNEFFAVSSRLEVTGDADWNTLVRGRGQPDSFGPAATDVGPWGGSIAFETFADWHFGLQPPGNPNEFDFFMAAQKSLMHLLGFGSSESWAALAATGQFVGPNAVGVFGAPAPLTDGKFEWAEDTLSQGQRTLMDADLEDGERIYPTALDLAAMQDIGWTPNLPPAPSPPPAADNPPVLSPAPIRPGTRLFAVGAGEGLDSRFTVNAAAQFVQLAEFNPYQSYASGGAAFTGGSRVVTADVNADGVEDLIVGPGPGIPTDIRVYSGANFPVELDSSLIAQGFAFEQSFTGGVFLAAADVDGDGVADVVISPDQGGGPRVIAISGRTRTVLADFFGIDDPDFRGGARTALGDLNGDGTPDLLVAAGFVGGLRLAAYDGITLRPGQTPKKLIPDFFIFEQTLRNGVFITSGDIDGDGADDLIAGGGPGGGPRVLASPAATWPAATRARRRNSPTSLPATLTTGAALHSRRSSSTTTPRPTWSPGRGAALRASSPPISGPISPRPVPRSATSS